MVAALLDTSVVIDLLRKFPAAQEWIAKQNYEIGVSTVVWLETLDGIWDKSSQLRALSMLKRFTKTETIAHDFEWAILQSLNYRLSHSVGYSDCLIAAANHRLQIPLYTMNLKHFTPMLGSLALKPY